MVTTEATQESILESNLWNVYYHNLTEREMLEESVLVRYSDDVAFTQQQDIKLAH